MPFLSRLFKPEVKPTPKTMTQITFITRLSIRYQRYSPEIRMYVTADHNITEAVAVSHYPEVYDVNTFSHSINDAGTVHIMTSGTRFTNARFNDVRRVETGLCGTYMALMGSFLVNEGISPSLLGLMENQEEANACVRECFYKLPYFATPPRGAFHYKVQSYTLESVAELFPEVTVTETSFSHEDVPIPRLYGVYNHPEAHRE